MNILVTGANGYIGSVLLQKGLTIYAYDTFIGIDNFIKNPVVRIGSGSNIKIFGLDINDTEAIVGILKDFKIDSIINLAAVVGDPACKKYPTQAHQSNHYGVLSLLMAIKESGRNIKFIQASTCSVYGFQKDFFDERTKPNPLSLYAELKLKTEEEIKNSGLDYSIFRFSTAFGWSPNMRFDLTVNEFTKDAYQGKIIEVYREDDWRPYAHVNDLASICLLSAMDSRKFLGTFNIGSMNNNYTKKMIIDSLKKYTDLIVKYVESSEDQRNYKSDFMKIATHFEGRFVFHTVNYGIIEIINNLRKGEFFYVDNEKYRSDFLSCKEG